MAISWLNYPPVANHISGDSFYADVINHCRKRDRFDSRLTEAHEISHYIHADIRNAQGGRVNAFYVGQDKAVVIKEPSMRKRDVAPYVPSSLRNFRFGTYITGQTEWDDRPLYVWDEWNAYVNGAITGVDLVDRKDYREGWTDGVFGTLEFMVYGAALAMAVKEKDPATFNDPQFIGFLEFQALRSEIVYMAGSKLEQFKFDRQDQMLDALRTSQDASNLRLFLKNYCKGAFLENKPPQPQPDTLEKQLFDLVGD